YASQSSSPCINLMEWLGLSDSEIVKLLKGGKAKQPKRLGADKEDCRQANMRYVHEMKQMAQCYDFEIYRYMQQIDHREQQAKFNARMNKLEEQAKLYRMERAFNNSWYAAYADVF
ncbi:MAG: replication initiation factor, partial [Neisseria sp.]